MSLAILASLTPSSIELKVTDELVEDIDFAYSADVVALSVNTTSAFRAYEVAKAFREKGAKIIMGGIHPSMMPDEAQAHTDSVVVGEAEEIWKEIIEDAANGTLKGRYQAEKYPDPKNIPYPAWQVLNSKRYFVLRTFQTSRGCPYGCSFCSSTKFFGVKHRFRPIENIIEEIKAYNKKFLVFVDDNIVGSHDYSRDLFRELKKCGKRWVAQSSVDISSDDELLRLAAESGCAGLLIGFESINPINKNTVKKLKQADEYRERIKKIKAYGIGVHGSFVFGFDSDTSDIFKSTVDFVMENKLEVANYCKLTPYPGTRIFEEFSSEGRILHNDWSKYDRYNIVFKPKNISIEELSNKTDEAYKKTYSLYSIFKRMPLSLKNIPYYLAINLSYWLGARLRRKK
jgi:radical SAM superfamily enzyme YgiQ (UPF0313 family)